MPKKLIFNDDDLFGKTMSNKRELVLEMPFEYSDETIRGSYSTFKNSKIVFGKGNIVTESKVMLSFRAEPQSNHFYLLGSFHQTVSISTFGFKNTYFKAMRPLLKILDTVE